MDLKQWAEMKIFYFSMKKMNNGNNICPFAASFLELLL